MMIDISICLCARLHVSRNKPRLVIEVFSFGNLPQMIRVKQRTFTLFIHMRPQNVDLKFLITLNEAYKT